MRLSAIALSACLLGLLACAPVLSGLQRDSALMLVANTSGGKPVPQRLLGAGARLVFDDEFDGTRLDTSKWSTCYWWTTDGGCTNAGNAELQWYQGGNVLVGQGTLRLRAERRSVNGYQYASGMIASEGKFSFQYGYVEARIKVPKGRGLWPALWAMPAVRNRWPPEIDVLEVLGHQPNVVYMSHHWRAANASGHDLLTWPYWGPDFSASFHTFGLLWESGKLAWYVDGVRRHVATTQVPAEPFYLIANLAVGGLWPGAPDRGTPFPSDYQIDYIRVWQKK